VRILDFVVFVVFKNIPELRNTGPYRIPSILPFIIKIGTIPTLYVYSLSQFITYLQIAYDTVSLVFIVAVVDGPVRIGGHRITFKNLLASHEKAIASQISRVLDILGSILISAQPFHAQTSGNIKESIHRILPIISQKWAIVDILTNVICLHVYVQSFGYFRGYFKIHGISIQGVGGNKSVIVGMGIGDVIGGLFASSIHADGIHKHLLRLKKGFVWISNRRIPGRITPHVLYQLTLHLRPPTPTAGRIPSSTKLGNTTGQSG